jgi:hypothetical protein
MSYPSHFLNCWTKRWPSFTPEEIYSPQSLALGLHLLDESAMDALQEARNRLNLPLVVNHGCLRLRGVRTIAENASIDGAASNSMHVLGKAFDVSCPEITVAELAERLQSLFLFNGIGIYKSWVHVDTRFSCFGSKLTIWNAT